MKSAYQIIRRPVITEKGLAIKENQNTLVFQVAPKATKTEIKEAVQLIFKVKVLSVRTAMYPGKERRRGKFAGYRPDWKKAYVRCGPGRRCRSTRRICKSGRWSFVVGHWPARTARSGRKKRRADG